MLGARGDPCRSLTLDDVEEDGRRRRLVVENSSISLLPNCPTHEHCDGGHSFRFASHQSPPFLNGDVRRPLLLPDARGPEPTLDHAPQPPRVSTLREKVGRRLTRLFA